MSNGTVACPQVFPQFNTQAKPLPMLYALTSEGKSRELLKLAAQFAVKRILDYTVAGLGVLLLGPLMLGIALPHPLGFEGPHFVPSATTRPRRQAIPALEVPHHGCRC